jgi:hypothetical protein
MSDQRGWTDPSGATLECRGPPKTRGPDKDPRRRMASAMPPARTCQSARPRCKERNEP